MNKSILLGTVVKTPDKNSIKSGNGMIDIANYVVKVPKKDKPERYDKIHCTAFGRDAEYAEENLFEGVRVLVVGHMQTNSYVNAKKEKIYTTEVVVESQEIVQ